MVGLYFISTLVIGFLLGFIFGLVMAILAISEDYSFYITAIVAIIVPVYLFSRYTIDKKDLIGFITYVALIEFAFFIISVIFVSAYDMVVVDATYVLRLMVSLIFSVSFIYWYANKQIS